MKLLTRAENSFLRFLFLAAITVVAGGLAAYLYMHPPFSKRLEATCQGKSESFSFNIHPKFYLNKKLLPSPTVSDADLSIYADRHLRYIHTSIPAFNKQDTPKFAAIPYDGYKISRIQQKDAKYPFNLEIYSNGIHPSLLKKIKDTQDLDSQYITKALAAGSTSNLDDAIEVTYDAEVKVLTCQDQTHQFKEQVLMPADPFLAFWFVPEPQRVVKYNEARKINERITPCATDDLLYDHDPYYYWYYWSLDDRRCADSINKDAFLSYKISDKQTISLETTKPFEMKFLETIGARPLKVTVSFTMIDDDSVFHPEPVNIVLKEKIDSILTLQDFEQARKAINDLSIYDIAIRSGLAFAWSMKNLSDEFKIEQLALEEILLQWKLTGKFKESQKNYEILVTIGSAMKEQSSYEKFYAALNEGLATSDIVYFGGHSGVGKNLSENRIHEAVYSIYGSLLPQAIPRHQVVMLMTCYSLRYFPLSSFPMPKKEFTRDVLYTASVPSGYDARMATGLLEQADKHLAKKRTLPFEKWPAHYNADVYLVHQKMQNAE
ncbi:hypothetical protein [Bdellovibrio sp. HCB337]|uniref:hypothetical protein n=1 Tax=Bdellovibrio sp. HCB337 TaxID=3394358 RepID=UPI0039A401E3